jgi:hypothetical protein
MVTNGVLLDPKYGEVKELRPHLSFISRVVNNQVIASVIAVITHSSETIYRIAFSDGYTSDFIYRDGFWFDAAYDPRFAKEKGASPYLFAIKDDLKSFMWFERYKSYRYFRINIEGEDKNIFVLVKEKQGIEYFNIHSEGMYLFSMIKTKSGWQAGSIYQANEPIDDILAKK